MHAFDVLVERTLVIEGAAARFAHEGARGVRAPHVVHHLTVGGANKVALGDGNFINGSVTSLRHKVSWPV